MSSPGYDSSKTPDSFFLILLFGVVGVYFVFQSNYWLIAGVWKYLRLIEMSVFAWVPDFLPFYGKLEIREAIVWLWKTPAVDIQPETVSGFDHHYLRWIIWVPSAVLVYFGLRKILGAGNVTNRYNMEALLRRVEPLYPHLKDFLTVHPDEKPILYKRNQKDTHHWAMSISPREYGRMSPPMGLERQAKKKKSLNAPIWDGKQGFDFDLAERAFQTQLGDRFTGIDHLKAHEKTIFDEFTKQLALMEEAKVEAFFEIARPLMKVKGAKPIPEGKMSNGQKALKEYIKKDIDNKKNLAEKKSRKNQKSFSPREYLQEQNVANMVSNSKNKELQSIFKLLYAEQIMGKHAFVRTGMMELLDRARDAGVFATDQIKWVKQVDRTLWYCVSSVGRKVSFVESAGVFAHWLIENQVGRPISHPEVSEAVQGLWKALKCDVEPE